VGDEEVDPEALMATFSGSDNVLKDMGQEDKPLLLCRV
jgi:hypothetical protein